MSKLKCSFCSKTNKEVGTLVTSDDLAICDSCVKACVDAIVKTDISMEVYRDAMEEMEDGVEEKQPITPRLVKEHLDKYIVGHDEAKRLIGIAVVNHLKRINSKSDIELDKSNILLVGPTGTGKTLFAKTIARLLDVPFAIADASSITEAGYVGDDVETILSRLLDSAGGDVELAQKGIVFIDEIDKKRALSSSSGQKDVSGAGVQQALLKIIEGGEAMVPVNGNKRAGGTQVRMKTDNILFILGGAFVGLERTIQSNRQTMGFGTSNEQAPTSRDATTEDFIKYGIIPELLGRIPVHIHLDALTEEQLIAILTQPKNSICAQYREIFRVDDVDLTFDQDALEEIAKIAMKEKTGARGLRTIIEKVLQDSQFILPEMKDSNIVAVRVDKDSISTRQPKTILKEGIL